jgi:hypothetical protein
VELRRPVAPAAPDLAALGRRFAIAGDFVEAGPYGSGHIHDTYLAVYRQADRPVRYIHQRLNRRIFPHPARLMDNLARVLAHQRERLRALGVRDADRRALALIATREGASHLFDEEGACWRTYAFVEGTRTFDQVPGPREAWQAARAYGIFQLLLADLPSPRLAEVIARFHDTPNYLARLAEIQALDLHGRAREAGPELDFILGREALAGRLLALARAARLPERTVHNDTKIGNVLFDAVTGEALTVIDLDTVMPGLAACDFGDLVRSAATGLPEDEPDPRRIEVRPPIFEALARGYLETAGQILTPPERESLVLAAQVITLECGIRFLTDHLEGDVYFKVHHPGHNLERCRTQLALLSSLEQREEDLQQLVAAISSGRR